MALLGTKIAIGIRLPVQVARWAPIPLRLIVGGGFLQHGLAKLSRGPDAFATILQALGVPAPHVMAWVTILIEVLGGFAVLAGAFVALVSLPMAALLVVAMYSYRAPALWVQLDQADERDRGRRSVRTTGV